MTTRIAVVVGNPSPNSRTRRVAEDLAARIAEVTGSEIDETIELAEVTDEIFEWIRSGDLTVHIGDRFPLTEVAAAFTALESRATTGKIILEH